MKYLIITAVLLSSCTKTYQCTIETTNSSNSDTITYQYEFKGTNQEMKEFEADGNSVSNFIDFTITQKTECK